MLALKIFDVAFLFVFFLALRWAWKHQQEVRQKVVNNGGMPREASRGLVYGLIVFLLAGVVMVNVYWLL